MSIDNPVLTKNNEKSERRKDFRRRTDLNFESFMTNTSGERKGNTYTPMECDECHVKLPDIKYWPLPERPEAVCLKCLEKSKES